MISTYYLTLVIVIVISEKENEFQVKRLIVTKRCVKNSEGRIQVVILKT